MVRDLVDHKGTVHPDIGSIVAYALSSNEYEVKRKNMREIRSSNGVPITLRLGYVLIFSLWAKFLSALASLRESQI